MAGIHCFAAVSGIEQGMEVTLSAAESRHVIKVMRVREGEAVVLLNGEGIKAQCELAVADVKAAQLNVVAVETVAAPACALHLAQVIPKGKSMDAIVRKATEIGVSSIYPLFSEHSEVRLDGERGLAKCAGWVATATEACKQCGCPFLPKIFAPQALTAFLSTIATWEKRNAWWFIASLEADAGHLWEYRSTLAQAPKHALWMIGPEGDFSRREYTQARETGCLPVHLASNVLRSETAATYALSILDYELNGMRL